MCPRYIFAVTSCLLQAFYLLLVERSGVDKGVGTTELLYYNALLSMPFLAVVGRTLAHPLRACTPCQPPSTPTTADVGGRACPLPTARSTKGACGRW